MKPLRHEQIDRSTLVRLSWLLWHVAVRAFRGQSALHKLQLLDDRILEDAGLHRSDLWSIADAYARGIPIDNRHLRRRSKAVYCAHTSIVPRITATQCPAIHTCDTDP